jgi:uncharacterized protein DUF3515
VTARRRAAGAVLGLALVLTATGCSSLEPGPQAGTPACTALVGRLPARVLDRGRTDLDVTGAAAWGDPAIVLRCGVDPTGPTDAPCMGVDGLDWTFTENDDGFRFVSFGRTPAVEVRVPKSIDRTTAPSALVDLSAAVKPLPASKRCVVTTLPG